MRVLRDLHGARPACFIALSRSADQSEDDTTAKDGSHVYGMTAMEAFLTIEFWLMVAIGFLVVGCGLMVINNIGEWEASKPASSAPSSVLQGPVVSPFVSFPALDACTFAGQVVPSLKGSKSMAAEYVTLLSVANCLGRLFSGFLSE